MPAAAESLTLFEAPKVHVFSLPPNDFLKSDNWEGNYIWSGALKFIREGNFFAVRLVEKDTNELFGECPIRDNNNNNKSEDKNNNSGESESVQPATDSTRAFVLRVEEGDQFSYVGLLFDDRTVAYNFSSALIHRRKGLGPAPTLPVQDHSLRQNESITVDLFHKVRVDHQLNAALDSGTSSLNANSPTVLGNAHLGGEIPRVDLFEGIEVSTSGKSRRVKCDSHKIMNSGASETAEALSTSSSSSSAAAAVGGSSSSSSATHQQKQSSPVDDIFEPSTATPPAAATGNNSNKAKKSSADALDDVFSGASSNNNNQQQQQQKSSAPKDVLDSLFG